jgi:chromosomal replication initiator protein
VKIDDRPLTIDDILDSVCTHFSVSVAGVNSKSRKHELVVARQVSMYLAQKYTKMPASRIGKLVGNRDHSTVIHSCSQVETRLKVDPRFSDEVSSIENSFKLKHS